MGWKGILAARRLGLALGLSALLGAPLLLGGCQNLQRTFEALVDLLPGDKGLGDKGREEAADSAPRAALPSGAEPPADAPPGDPSVFVQAGRFAPQDTAAGVLAANGVEPSQVAEAVAASRTVHSLSRIGAGRRYEVAMAKGRLRRFTVQVDDERRMRIYRTGRGTLRARLEAIPYEVEAVRLQGVIRDSLFGAVAETGAPPQVALALSEIFDYVIDFHKDLNDGDRIEVLIERRFLAGRDSGFGRILAAEFVVGGKRHAAFYFDAGRGDYYTPDGRTLRRTFLRSPLRYTRISSRFSHRRFHPILKRFRPHYGVDYAAPLGTPVRAVADGVVTWAGPRGQAGNMVSLLHGGGYRTSYMHLLRFARGVRPGRRVAQGRVIGFVGSTGLSTGPHLDYRITHKGRPLDPLRPGLPEGRPLPRRHRAAFAQLVRKRRAALASAPLLDRGAALAAVRSRF